MGGPDIFSNHGNSWNFFLRQRPGCTITVTLGLSHGFLDTWWFLCQIILITVQLQLHRRWFIEQKELQFCIVINDILNCQHSFHGCFYLGNITDSWHDWRWKGSYRDLGTRVPSPLPQAQLSLEQKILEFYQTSICWTHQK